MSVSNVTHTVVLVLVAFVFGMVALWLWAMWLTGAL